jgi:chromosome segregation ATPase
MSNAQQTESEFRDWERKYEVAQRAHDTNVKLSYIAKQQYEKTARTYKDMEEKFRRVENEYRRLEREKSQLESDMISCEAEMKQAKQDLDIQEGNARSVDDQLADAKWKVSDMKAKWERAKTEERAQQSKDGTRGGSRY